MPWYRQCVGHVIHNDVVHILYEWFKDGRRHWDTQCGLAWGNRNNTDVTLRPPTVEHPLTCIECVAFEAKLDAQALAADLKRPPRKE